MSAVKLARTAPAAAGAPLATELARLVERLFEMRAQAERIPMNGGDRLDLRSNLLCAVKSLYRVIQIIDEAEKGP